MSAEVERAKALLEKLVTRTQARGATAAEAATAAELAAKIAHRYGLDQSSDAKSERTVDLSSNRLPPWMSYLASGFEKRFGCEVWRKSQYCRNWLLFRGEEHVVRVACWLYTAIVRDLNKLSLVSGEQLHLSGPKLLRYRNEFRKSAAFEIWMRMAPPKPIPQAELEAALARAEQRKKRGNSRALCRRASEADIDALIAGSRVGKSLSLGTDALGDRRGPVLAIGR